MSTTIQTKEQLLIELTQIRQLLIELPKIRQSNEEWVAGDVRRRKEFARAFGWNKAKKHFDYGEAELCEPTWMEIFVKLGKLLSAKNFYDFEGNVSELECKLEELKNEVRQNIKKKV